MEDAGLAPVLQIVGTYLAIGCLLAAGAFALVYLIRLLTAALHFVAWIFRAAFGFIAKLIGSLRSLSRPKVAAPTKHKPAKKKSAPAKQNAVPRPPPPAKPVQKPEKPEKPENHNPDQLSLKKVIAQLKHKPASGGKTQAIGRHRLDLNTLKGHGDAVGGIAFSSSGSSLASVCSDGYVRIFKIEDASSKSQHCLKLKVPPGGSPADVCFGESEEEVLVVTQDIMGADLVMYGPEAKAAAAKKLPQPEQKWSKKHIHGMKNVLMCAGARGASGALIATCSEGTDVKVWTSRGDCVATVDTNQLRNSMAAVSPDGRFLLAAAFTGDVKIWEINYGKDGKVRDVTKVMLLKGHKSAVTWACFTWDSQRVITASKDGSWRIWNINVRYHMDEDPKCLRVFPIQQNGRGELAQFDMISVSPDNRVLAVTQAAALKWLSTDTGDVLETATNAHDDSITGLCWAPRPLQTDQGRVPVLATSSLDKKVKLWLSP